MTRDKLLAACLLTFVFIWSAAPIRVSAATFTVNQLGDAGDGVCDSTCTLRDAVATAPNGSLILFDPSISSQTHLLTQGEILINKNLTIQGHGAFLTGIQNSVTGRVFRTVGSTVRISDLSISGFSQGGIYALHSSLRLERIYFSQSQATRGGAIYFDGAGVAPSSIRDCTFVGNTGNTGGGGFYNDGSVVAVSNSTFWANTSFAGGGAIANSGSGSTTIRNSTIAGNTAAYGGGISHDGGMLDIGNSIIAGNTGTGNPLPEIAFANGTVVSSGNNLVGDASGDAGNTANPIPYLATDILDTPPLLGSEPLLNGGPIPTMELLAGSDAIDAGDNTLAVDPSDNSPLMTDQRGFLRFIGWPVATVDIGAYEFGSAASWSTPIPTASNVSVTAGPVTVTFSDVAMPGEMIVTPLDPAAAGPVPMGFTLGAGYPAYEISTTTDYTPPLTVCIQVPAVSDPVVFNALRILHYEDGALLDRTSSRNFPTRTVCAIVASLSPFVVAQSLTPDPTPTPTPEPTPTPTPEPTPTPTPEPTPTPTPAPSPSPTPTPTPSPSPTPTPTPTPSLGKLFTARLTGASVVPPVNTSGVGAGAVALVPGTGTRLAAGVIFKDLKSRPTAVHIHGPANPGANAPVLFTLRIISVNRRNQKWSGEAIGFFNVTAAQLANLRAGRWYMDVHTEGRPNGEIRGQLTVLSVAFHGFDTGSPSSDLNAFLKVNEPLTGVNDAPSLEFWKVLDTARYSKWTSVPASARRLPASLRELIESEGKI